MSARWSHSRPTDIACALSGGDAAFVSGNGARTVNGNPGAMSLCSWRTGAQTLTTEIDYDLTWANGIMPTDIGIIGCTLPVGTLVNFSFKRSGDTGFPYNLVSQRLIQRPYGERVAIYSLPLGLTNCVGARIAILNDVNGVASITAGQQFKIGELWVGKGDEPDMDVAFQDEYQDATTSAVLDLWQQYEIRGTVRRVRTFTPANQRIGEIYGDGNVMPTDMETLFACTSRRKRIMHIPFRANSAGAYDAQLVNRSAIFGVLTKNAISKHLENRLFGFGDMVLTEIPVPV